ncbi:hypothetical protein CUC44_12445 [Aeromonas lusitana]|uniref:Uncharacterized protein n=2 Tax=Aeromonas lusitana TaxID=931529 RepID=A0A2M8H8J6_9GAMM|nr:hypothetical protein CUC44_12445 [Aeromonas lusitana]
MAVRGYQITAMAKRAAVNEQGAKETVLAVASTISWGQQLPFLLKNNVFLYPEQHLSMFDALFGIKCSQIIELRREDEACVYFLADPINP